MQTKRFQHQHDDPEPIMIYVEFSNLRLKGVKQLSSHQLQSRITEKRTNLLNYKPSTQTLTYKRSYIMFDCDYHGNVTLK